jgi:hypothetical protein
MTFGKIQAKYIRVIFKVLLAQLCGSNFWAYGFFFFFFFKLCAMYVFRQDTIWGNFTKLP